jgi:iron complex outermembrane receptor protein
VDRSYRRGLELDAAWQVNPALRLRSSVALSRNRIHSWTQVFDVYDADFNWTGTQSVRYDDVEPLLTPAELLNAAVEYTPGSRWSAGMVARWVGRSFLDNTNDAGFETPSYLVADANASLGVTPWMRVSLQVNNLFDEQTVYGSGYSYRYFQEETRSGTAYYFPQATRNAVVLLDFGY